jgi:hypothetical protein
MAADQADIGEEAPVEPEVVVEPVEPEAEAVI